ncbi:disA bacterial checkpoint controller nucleotide-binding domain-containing protein [Ditylenchus destructor]|nr:disA bacterial checkpoint controller nucleotide-binding domain-containing protein [Ditylenchus destructor]
MTPSGIKSSNPSDNIKFVKERIDKLADELYALARKNWWRKAIGGTVIVNHLCEKTTVWHETKQTFISQKPYNRAYKPGDFKKIFTSKSSEHDGAVTFHLRNGLIDSISAKLPMRKHDCKQCAGRGTRHTSACSFSNFAAVPIIVISEEKGQVSLFFKGRAQFGIEKEDLKKELLKAYVTEKETCLAYTTFIDEYFSEYSEWNPLFLNDHGNYKWSFEFYTVNIPDLHKDTSFKPDINVKIVTPEGREHYALAERYTERRAKTKSSYAYKMEKSAANGTSIKVWFKE